jgi:hypothetical protein
MDPSERDANVFQDDDTEDAFEDVPTSPEDVTSSEAGVEPRPRHESSSSDGTVASACDLPTVVTAEDLVPILPKVTIFCCFLLPLRLTEGHHNR